MPWATAGASPLSESQCHDDLDQKNRNSVAAADPARAEPGKRESISRGLKFPGSLVCGNCVSTNCPLRERLRELFQKTLRAFSHGCIRLEKAAELAAYLLRESPEWNGDAIAAAIGSRLHRSVRLHRPVPLHVGYVTAWVDPDGTVQFRTDIYQRDQV